MNHPQECFQDSQGILESWRHSCGWFNPSPARPQARKIPWGVLEAFLRVVRFITRKTASTQDSLGVLEAFLRVVHDCAEGLGGILAGGSLRRPGFHWELASVAKTTYTIAIPPPARMPPRLPRESCGLAGDGLNHPQECLKDSPWNLAGLRVMD